MCPPPLPGRGFYMAFYGIAYKQQDGSILSFADGWQIVFFFFFPLYITIGPPPTKHTKRIKTGSYLPVTLSHPLEFVLLLDSIAITAPLGRIDQFLGQAFGHTLHISEGCFTGANSEEGNGLVNPAKG